MDSSLFIQDARAKEWILRFEDQAASGLTVEAWCEKNFISKSSYYYWKKRIKDSALDAAFQEIVPVPASFPSSPDDHSIPVAMTDHFAPHGTSSLIRISLGDVSIDICSNVSSSMLSSVIKAVRHA